MNSANGAIRDLESFVYIPTISSIDEKQSVKTEADKKFEKMSKLQHCIFTVLLLSLLTVGIVAATLNNKSPQDAVRRISLEESRFQELLNTVDPSVLHDVLHENMKDKYKHGVFQEDKTAVEAIHQQNAEVAESLIELAKRQATSSGNGTVVTTTALTTTDSVVTSTESITTTPSPTPSSTPIQPESQSSSTPPSSQESTSVPESSATSTAPSSTSTEVVSKTSSGTTTAPPSSSEATPTSTSSTPKSQGSSTSSSPSSQSGSESGTKTSPSSSRTTIYTTTMANGALTTVTSVTVIPAGQADQTTGGSGPATTSGGNASLQTGGVGKVEVGLAGLVGGAVMAVIGVL